jgi:hypothetical protein
MALAASFQNPEFRFSVEVPDSDTTCHGQPYEHDHGLDILLDSGRNGCEALQSRPHIGIYAAYNTTFDAGVDAELQRDCKGVPVKLGTSPPPLRLGNGPSGVCRLDRDDGWIDIRVVTQAGEWPGKHVDPEDATPYINYTVLLHTTPQRLKNDLAELRTVIGTVHIFPAAAPSGR